MTNYKFYLEVSLQGSHYSYVIIYMIVTGQLLKIKTPLVSHKNGLKLSRSVKLTTKILLSILQTHLHNKKIQFTRLQSLQRTSLTRHRHK